MSHIPFEIHEKFLPLLESPHTYADVHGGRYGCKTEQVHKCAIQRALLEPIRMLGVRETLTSTADSSHKTLSDIIYGHEMATTQNGPFEVLGNKIVRKDGERIESEIFYVGVRENVRDKKSTANIDLVVFDEAGKCSEDSLKVFLPTVIRKPGCRAWFIWNPELVTDPVWRFFQDPPKGTIHIETSYLDNPWLSEEARNLVEHTRLTNFSDYEHLYLGKPLSEVKGAIFAGEIAQAEKEGRITDVPYDRTRPVHTSWDLGFGDPTCIWFVQEVGGWLHFIDYISGHDLPISEYIIQLQARGYVYGVDYLPHDAVDAIIHRKLMGSTDVSMTIPLLMAQAGRRVVVGAKLLKQTSLNAARLRWPICRIDKTKCADGLHGLRYYEWDRLSTDAATGDGKPGQRKPNHNWASHPADSWIQACISIKTAAAPDLPRVSAPRRTAGI